MQLYQEKQFKYPAVSEKDLSILTDISLILKRISVRCLIIKSEKAGSILSPPCELNQNTSVVLHGFIRGALTEFEFMSEILSSYKR